MSRSRKKEAVYKDPSNKLNKAIASRKLRRRVKQAIQRGDDAMPMDGDLVVDFRTRGWKLDDKEESERLKRK